MFKNKDGEELQSISIYSGINRGIFRKGVALTSSTLRQKSMGKDPYDTVWDLGGIADIAFYAGVGVGVASVAAGVGLIKAAPRVWGMLHRANQANLSNLVGWERSLEDSVNKFKKLKVEIATQGMTPARGKSLIDYQNEVSNFSDKVADAENTFEKADAHANKVGARMSKAGKWLAGIGAAIIVAAAIVKAVQMSQYYNRDFTTIPTMIVDEADIVSYAKDENGNKVKNVNFDQFVYYDVVKCNRQEVGIHKSAQKGVSDYKSWGCGDAADLNADIGKQWLAMYVNRSSAKGSPILADSVTLKTGEGSDKIPQNCNHMCR